MEPVVHEHFPGTSLGHILGCEARVSTAYHSLTGCIKDHGGPLRTLSFWAMPARNYIKLDVEYKNTLQSLQKAGAIKVLEFQAEAKDLDVDLKKHRGANSLPFL
jgi:hypothetical protein